jgi:hypothetical protein
VSKNRPLVLDASIEGELLLGTATVVKETVGVPPGELMEYTRMDVEGLDPALEIA